MPMPVNIIPDRFLSAVRGAYGSTLAATLFQIPADTSLADFTGPTEHLLGPKERELFAGFRLAKRQKEWLAGRLCVKQAICEHSRICDPGSIAILNREDGSPYALINGSESPHMHISISHSGELAAGLVANNYCGIDIQEERQTLISVQQRFCSPYEETLLDQNIQCFSSVRRLNLLWSCKEAIRKLYNHQHIPGFLELCCSAVNKQDEDIFHFRFQLQQNGRVLSVLCCVFGDYALAISVLKGENNA